MRRNCKLEAQIGRAWSISFSVSRQFIASAYRTPSRALLHDYCLSPLCLLDRVHSS